MIERIAAALGELGLDPTPVELQDTIWLALQMGPVGQPPAAPRPKAPPEPPAAGASVEVDSPPPEAKERIGQSRLYYRQGRPQTAGRATSTTVLSPGVPALPDGLGIGRALRVLKRRVPARSEKVLDEVATAELKADTGVLLPVMRPAPSRWLDLHMVVDESASMAVWRRTVIELQQLLEYHGAFRDVRVWSLSTDEDPEGSVLLRPRVDRAAAGGAQPRDPLELLDPTGRRLVLVVSDGVSPAWGSRSVRATVALWGHAGPVAILQLLPERLWPQTALLTESVYLRAPGPGAPNAQLLPLGARPAVGKGRRQPIPVPVIELDRRWLEAWSELTAGSSGSWVAGAVSYFDDQEQTPAQTTSIPARSARELVERFRATASPTAYELACYLAAVPLSLPVMHLVQRAMLPRSGLGHLAEVFLSGLIERQEPGDDSEFEYKFAEGVGDLLLNAVRRGDAAFVLQQVGSYIERRDNQSYGFTAVFADRDAEVEISESNRAFAVVAAKVLRRLGVRYAGVAEKFEEALRAAPPDAVDGVHDRQTVGGMEKAVAAIDVQPVIGTSQEPRPPTVPGAVRIALLGAPNSGKTTFLATLPLALLDRSLGRWNITANTQAAADFLATEMDRLDNQGEFPTGTQSITSLSWTFTGDLRGIGPPRRSWRQRRDGDRVEFTIEVQDAPGYVYGEPSADDEEAAAEVMGHLAASQGLIYLFDPVTELVSGDSFRFFRSTMDRIKHHTHQQERFRDAWLPHHLAVCISKFDDPTVFESARRDLWVTWAGGSQMPRVADNHAADFFAWICRRYGGSTELIRKYIDLNFRKERVAYFVTSSIGFRSTPREAFGPADYVNVEMVAGRPRIRGDIHPINVLEPFVWLERQVRSGS